MEHEAIIRLTVFLGLFSCLATLEAWLPRKERTQSRRTRWFTNWSIIILDTITLRLLAVFLPFLAVGAAQDASDQGWGILNQFATPLWAQIIITILVFDLAIWFQHMITHKIPFLWRFHRVHHADRDIDVTTAIRFHPVEIAVSMLLKISLVYLIGPPVIGIILFEIILNGTAMFNHANIHLPLWLDRIMRKVLVTPDMHRVHHSIHRYEHDSNYGFSLSIWDHLFRTYIAQPEKGHDNMTTGLHWQNDNPSKLRWSLWLPFRRN